MLARADVQRVGKDLLRGERGYREGGRGLPADTVRFTGQQRGRGDQQRRPGALTAQRHRMRHHRVARRPVADRIAHRREGSGRLHPQRHRRHGAHVPAADADELIPVAHAGRPRFQQHLVARQRPRLSCLDHLDRAARPANPGCPHLSSPGRIGGRHISGYRQDFTDVTTHPVMRPDHPGAHARAAGFGGGGSRLGWVAVSSAYPGTVPRCLSSSRPRRPRHSRLSCPRSSSVPWCCPSSRRCGPDCSRRWPGWLAAGRRPRWPPWV